VSNVGVEVVVVVTRLEVMVTVVEVVEPMPLAL
jgi:hypothetical protein